MPRVANLKSSINEKKFARNPARRIDKDSVSPCSRPSVGHAQSDVGTARSQSL